MQQMGQPEQDDGPMKPPSATSNGRPVVLSIPTDREQVVLVRSVAGHIAARHGLSVADLTDLRLAVDEACGLFLLSSDVMAAADTLECRFDDHDGALRFAVSAPIPPGFAPDTEDVGWIMLGALVDELSWRADAQTGTVSLTKRLVTEV